MEEDLVRLVYTGGVLPGHDRDTVYNALADWLKLEGPARAALCAGRRVIIKRSLPAAQGPQWVTRFEQRGALLLLESMQPTLATAAPPATASMAAAPARPPVPRPAAPTPATYATTAAAATAAAPMARPALASPGLAPRSPAGAPALAPARTPVAAPPLTLTPLPPPVAAPPPQPPASWGGDPAAAPQLIKTIAPPSEEMMDCPACGERQSKRILCRACACDMPRGIAAKQEAAEAARAERQAEAEARRYLRSGGSRRPKPATSRRSSRRHAQDTRLSALNSRLEEIEYAPLFGLRFDGRLGRMSYFAGGLVFWSGLCVLILFMVLMPGILSILLSAVMLLVMLVWSSRLTVLRLHDINRSGWWTLALSIPTIGSIASLVLMLIPGNADDNDYGEPVPERHAGLAIAAVVVISLCVSMGWKATMAAYQRHSQQQQSEEDEAEARDQSRTPREKLQALLGSSAAVDAFLNTYVHSAGHRAFASAGAGAWGMRTGASSRDQAALDALADCKLRVSAGEGICQLVHVDGDWVIDPNR